MHPEFRQARARKRPQRASRLFAHQSGTYPTEQQENDDQYTTDHPAQIRHHYLARDGHEVEFHRHKLVGLQRCIGRVGQKF
jgi:hypothetical protein